MICPKCIEEFSLLDAIKLKLRLMVPYSIEMWLAKREQNNKISALPKLMSGAGYQKLTQREYFVCDKLATGASIESVAEQMNVTRERIRQMLAKAVRKMERKDSEKR
jgi:DNA-directed RNA polymerase sigma subunit (sigma70/sigma32)